MEYENTSAMLINGVVMDVLILVLMEYENIQNLYEYYNGFNVLILVLMEYENTVPKFGDIVKVLLS